MLPIDLSRARMGIGRVLLAALLTATNLWLARGAFVPLPAEGVVAAYALVTPSFGQFLAWFAGALAVLIGLQAVVWRRVRTGAARFFTSTRHLGPLWWSALSLLPLANLHAAVAGRLPAATYVFFDLRWFWWPLLVVATMRHVLPAAADRAARRRSGAWWTTGVLLVPVAAAVLFTTHIRFSGVLHGDEPKYLRYCENFFQGVGFNVAAKRPLHELAPGEGPRLLRNGALLASAVVEEAQLLWGDVRRIAGRSGSPRLVSSEPSPAMFFQGKHPGTVYQLHNPGLAFLLFPGYLLDRMWTGGGLGYQREFPSEMPAVHLSLLLLYAGYALSLYLLLQEVSGSRAHGWALAVVGAVALPAGAFAFQIYPDVAAGLIVFVLARELVAPRATRAARLALLGLLSGFLPWLHVRLGLVTLLVLGIVLVSRGRGRRQRAWFAAGAMAGLGALSAYTYRLTGSLLPVATYGADAPLSIAKALQGVPALLLDRDWGLIPLAPIYLLAMPGLAIAWRERRAAAAIVLALFAAVVVPAAAHGFWAGGSTPGRYLVAGAPLLLVFALRSLTYWRASRLAATLALAAALLTIETAVRYNLHHVKEYGPLVAPGVAGWRPNLLFPSLGMGEWTRSPAELGLFAAWVLLLAGLLAHGALSARRAVRADVLQTPSRAPALSGLFALLALIATGGEALALGPGRRTADAYLLPMDKARDIALATFAEQPQCAICFITGRGAGDPSPALRNEIGQVVLRLDSRLLVAGDPIFVTVRPRSTDGAFVAGTIRVDFGDGATAVFPRHFGDRTVRHVYVRDGTYQLRAWVRTPDGRSSAADLALEVTPRLAGSPGGRPAVKEVP